MHNKRTYELLNLDTGNSITLDGVGRNTEPIVESSDKTWKRSTKDFAFTFEFSKDYQFTQNGALFITNAYNNRDVEANVQFKEIRYHPHTDIPYTYIIGVLDFSEYSRGKTKVSIPIKSGGLKALIKSKRSKKVELGVLESLNGKAIDPLITKQFAVVNRSVVLASKLETNTDNETSDELVFVGRSPSYYGSSSIPLSVVYQSDTGVVPSLPNMTNENSDTIVFSTAFYDNSDTNKNLELKITGSVNVRIKRVFFLNTINFEDVYRNGTTSFSAKLLIYNPSGNIKNRIACSNSVLFSTSPISNNPSFGYNEVTDHKLIIEKEINLQIDAGDYICLMIEYNYSPFIFQTAFIVNKTNTKVKAEITETSNINDINRRSKCVLNKDAGENLMQIITGEKNRYYSEYFSNSEFELTATTTGKWIRGFLDSKYTTSFNDFIANAKSILAMAYNVEVIKGVETIVHEPLKHFFQQGVVLELPNQVSDVKRSVAKEFVFSSVSSGYKKPSGDNLYEEVSGLKEVNITNDYIAPITKITQDYDILSPYSADSEGKELTARLSTQTNPTTDYRRDNNIFNLDLKDVGTDVYAERTWQDDYEIAPYSDNSDNPVFEPDTLTGLRFTPFRNMERHFWLLNNAYTKEANKFIRYASTRGNAEFITKKANEEAKSENGKYPISELEPPLFMSKWVKFKHVVTDDIISVLEGTTNINGREIPNLYFKIGFINEFGNKEYGYLFELKPDKAGEWKILKAL